MAQKMQAKTVALALTALVLAHGAVGALIDDCKADPSTADCADSETYYNDAAVAADVKGLCEMMPQMPSCRIRELCESGEIADTSGHCGEWNLLSGICSTQYGESMQGMAGCTTYKMICADGSVVESCSDVAKQGPAELITTAEAKANAIALCEANPDLAIDAHEHEEEENTGLSPADEVVLMDEVIGGYRRHGAKLCDECDSAKCHIAMTILAHGCKTDMSQSMCAELKKTCDANKNLNEICTFVDKSAAAPLHARFILVLSGLVSVVALTMR
eukprot:CAMPEP_0177698196 /NCGR_PEP_ID=MMETSP0484_2-20121128/4911_1 /TAXON_ID=354590 /ORGANISM="Rhodomonas lens, Strain RHODO" /LENGTH=273 /DNA_ID=CAMNT_0019209271 /DNA_START=16 /DNA_END=837 /DNA_ORIENTATION=-